MLRACIGVSAGLTLYYSVLWLSCGSGICNNNVLQIALLIGQSVLLTSFGLVAVRLVRRDINLLWTPAFIFLVSTGLFFGFGSLSTFMVDQLTVDYMRTGNYFIDPLGLTRTNVLTMSGVTILLTTMSFFTRLRLRNKRTSRRRLSIRDTTISFLSAGLLIKFGLVLPSQFGLTSFVVPGFLANLAPLADLGFTLAAYSAAKGSRGWALLFWVLWPIYLSVGLLEFTKTTTTFTILLPALGSFMAHRRLIKLVPWVILWALLFSTMQNVNTVARIAVIAVGDMSHALTNNSPADFHPDGEKYDKKIQELIAQKNTVGLISLDEKLIENAVENSYRSLTILFGLLDRISVKPEILNYEAPFGVGYLVANFAIK